MPKTPDQYDAIRQQRRQQIIQTALRLFAKKSYEGTSMQQIAYAAGVSKGLIYNYFKSKETLMIAILRYGFDELIGLFDPNKAGVLTEDEFIYFIEMSFKAVDENRDFWKFYMSLLMQPDVAEYVEKEFMEELYPLLEKTATYYRNKGVQKPEAMARFAGAVLDGITIDYILDPDHFPLEAIKEMFIERFIKNV